MCEASAAIVGTIIIGAATAGVAAFVALPAGAGILAAGSAAAALAPIATSSALVVAGAAAGGAAGGASIAAAAKMTAQELGARLEPNSEATIRGQYAGPDWPFRCDRSRHITLQMAGVEPAKMPMAIWSLTQARHFVLPRRTTAATV